MGSRLMRLAQTLLETLDVSHASPLRSGVLTGNDGMMLTVEGLPAAAGSAVRIAVEGREPVRGEVLGFRDRRSLVLPFETGGAFARGARVVADGIADQAECGAALLGRVVDALGSPLDGKGPIAATGRKPLAGHAANPLQKGGVDQVFDVGVRAINALITIGRGQRVAIIAGSGVGKSVLLSQIMSGAECDAIVVGLIGERSREVSDFVDSGLSRDAKTRSVVVATPADQAPHLRLRAAMRATAIAEGFRDEGKHVLLVIDSLTRVAHAQREIGLALGEPPTVKGYPPSVLGTIPRLIERAGADRASGGSITAVHTILADGGDLDDPIVDSVRSISDGHIVLSRSLAEQGVFPAIDIGRSLSRTMHGIVDSDHAAAAVRFRELWASWEENRDLQLMGAYVPGADAVLDAALASRPAMLGMLRQARGETAGFATSRSQLLDCWAQ